MSGQLPPRKISPSMIAPPPKITPKIIAPWQYSPGNCPRLPFGWLVPTNIVPRINYTLYIFSPRFRNRSTLIDSYFLFPPLWFNLVLDFDFCIRKNFTNGLRLKLLKKQEQVRNNLSMEYWNRIFYAFVTDRD